MHKARYLIGLLVLVLAVGGDFARAQNSTTARQETCCSPQEGANVSSSDLTKAVLKEIQDIEQRVVAISEDFPNELYNTYRPQGNTEVRTAAEILMHIAEQNSAYASLMRTKQQQDALVAAGKIPHAKDLLTFVSKPATVAEVKASFAAVRNAIQENPDPKNLKWWLYIIAHANGHFGNLVTYYRNNGLVPPTSRQ